MITIELLDNLENQAHKEFAASRERYESSLQIIKLAKLYLLQIYAKPNISILPGGSDELP